MKKGIIASSFFFAMYLFPALVSAHAFGQQYTLPLPFQFYAFGASCALIVSFVFLSLYSTPEKNPGSIISVRKTYVIRKWNAIEFILRTIGVFGLIATLAAAFVGPEDFTLNPAPELFWVILLLGFTYLSVFVDGLWPMVSPFETLARIFLAKNKEPLLRYPEWLGYIPATGIYFFLIWFELLSYGAGAEPSAVGEFLLGYALFSIIGAGLFGIEEWFAHGDFFTVFFGLIGLFAPVKIERGLMHLQPPAERLVLEQAGRMGLLIFVLFMLSSTAFDGLEETQIWWNTLYHSALQMQIYPIERILILLASPFIFFGLYAFAIWLMRLFTRTRLLFTTLAIRFAFSLVPIAIAYNFAHYFTLLVTGAQAIYQMASDPFSKGWDLFGTVHYQVNALLIDAKYVWYAQFASILLGHIIATYVAHRIALKVFPTRAQIIAGQLPMLLLMVFYTVFGLWILSQGYQTGA